MMPFTGVEGPYSPWWNTIPKCVKIRSANPYKTYRLWRILTVTLRNGVQNVGKALGLELFSVALSLFPAELTKHLNSLVKLHFARFCFIHNHLNWNSLKPYYNMLQIERSTCHFRPKPAHQRGQCGAVEHLPYIGQKHRQNQNCCCLLDRQPDAHQRDAYGR